MKKFWIILGGKYISFYKKYNGDQIKLPLSQKYWNSIENKNPFLDLKILFVVKGEEEIVEVK